MNFYIIIAKDDRLAIVSDSAGEPREFPKVKKAENFLRGRAQAWDDWQIVDKLPNIKNRERVN